LGQNGTADGSVWSACEGENVGRSLLSTDMGASNVQWIDCVARNCGNTTYVDQQHDVYHFEGCAGGLIQNCRAYYDCGSDYQTNDDTRTKYVVRVNASTGIMIDGLDVKVDASFSPATTPLHAWGLFAMDDPGNGDISMTNVVYANDSDEIDHPYLGGGDVQWTDSSLFGPIAVNQASSVSTILRLENVHVNGNGRQFDFYYLRYGIDPDGIITNCTFENIDGWAIAGHFDNWKICGNVFRNVNGVNLLNSSGNAYDKSNDSLIEGNLFEDCNTVLGVYWATTAAVHKNYFCGNTISGQSQTVYCGGSPGTSVYWLGNTKAENALWTRLAINNGFHLWDTLLSEYDNQP
jgi:hypothetical protein